MPRGYLSILLHAHLPFVRHPEHAEFLEEKWLFEAVADCYLPLLSVLEKIAADAIPCRLTLSISPTLAAMLDDELLRTRCRDFLRRRADEAKQSTPTVAQHFATALAEYERRNGELLKDFLKLRDKGLLELITTSATHAFLPLLKNQPTSIRAQVRIGLDDHARRTGKKSEGFWLPECGYFPELGAELAAAGIDWSVVDTHAFTTAQPHAPSSIFAPTSSNGVAYFARDPDSAREVWGPGGYPGAPAYRDFHAQDHQGFKHLAITGGGLAKKTYDAQAASDLARRHAQEFVETRIGQILYHAFRCPQPQIIVAAYDAELFGHWWHEGPQFLDHVIRTVAAHRKDIALATPSDYLALHATTETATPGASSWGQHGYSDFWLNASNNWIHPELKRTANVLTSALASSTPEMERALRQAARSLLIAQSSDWPFLMTRGPSASYAEKRLRDQISRVHYLCGATVAPDSRRLQALEQMDNIFPEFNPRHFLENQP